MADDHEVSATGVGSGAQAGQLGFEARSTGVPSGRGLEGNPWPVVRNPHAAVGRERHLDRTGTRGQNLVHRPAHDLEHQLMQAAFPGRADPHPRPPPNGFPPLQHLDPGSVVPHAFSTHEAPSDGVRQIAPA